MEPQVASRRPLIGPFITLTRRVVRKLIRWYVSPQVRQMGDQLQELSARLREHDERLGQATRRVAELESWALDEFGRLHDLVAEAESSRVRLQAGEVSQWAQLQGQLDQLRAAVTTAGEQLGQRRERPEAS